MRLFIAIGLPDGIKEYIAGIHGKISFDSNKLKFVRKDQLHLTLKFLGEVQPNGLDEIKNNLKRAKFASFSVVLGNIGVFQRENDTMVIWVGLKPEEPILNLQKNIDESLKKLFKKEKNFKAHLTLARVKYASNKEEFIKKLKNLNIENKKIEIDKFKLVKSTLTKEGPVYEDLETFG